MSTNPSIFKAYDIRGVYPTEFDETAAYDISRAVATLFQRENPGKKLTLVVGRDMRLSSPALRERVVAGLLDSGVNVVDVGLASTPTFYFSVAQGNYDGGIQVSASHNPKQFNGMKIVRAHGVPVGRDTGMNDLKQIVADGSYTAAEPKGVLTTMEHMTELCAETEGAGIPIEKIKPFTIVIDAANAMGALDMVAIFKKLPCTVIKLNFELDGTFPAHQPDPLDPENLKVLQDAVREHHADFGIAPDGDGDRVFFVANDGQLIRQEILRGIMAQVALKEQPGATVCYDIRPGRVTRDMIEAVGGRGVVTPVGHSLIKAVMLKEHAVFGGESSGHYFYKFPFGTFESSVALILKFLVWLSKKNTTLAEAVKPYQIYFHSGEINSRVADVKTVLARIKERFHDGNMNELDGVTVEYDDWWFNVRGSNTEPLIRLNLEAKSRELMEQKRDEVVNVIQE